MTAIDLEPGHTLQTSIGGHPHVVNIRTYNQVQTVHSLTINKVHTYHVGAGTQDILVHNSSCPSFPRDYPTKNTNNWSANYGSEREARAVAREKIGRGAVEVEPYKWRSIDGKWQFRAKPGDVSDRHIHLEELNPTTGEVLQNVHLRW